MFYTRLEPELKCRFVVCVVLNLESYLYSPELDVIRNEPGQTMAQEKHHDVPAEHMVCGPADDKARHKAL